MTRKQSFNVVVAITLLLGTNLVCAAVTATNTVAMPAATKASAPASKHTRKAVPKGKMVDINSANKAALKKLPGITDALADKIIASRPYGSKAWLVSNGVIDQTTYGKISGQIEAKQPFKTAAENVAFYEKLKKEKAAKP
jgi:DNA uptake protein ComE-like DNA-binding protein